MLEFNIFLKKYSILTLSAELFAPFEYNLCDSVMVKGICLGAQSKFSITHNFLPNPGRILPEMTVVATH